VRRVPAATFWPGVRTISLRSAPSAFGSCLDCLLSLKLRVDTAEMRWDERVESNSFLAEVKGVAVVALDKLETDLALEALVSSALRSMLRMFGCGMRYLVELHQRVDGDDFSMRWSFFHRV